MRAKVRIPDPHAGMNRLEAAWAQVLELERRAGTIVSWRYEAMTLRLGPDCRYTPDFLVILPDGGMRFDEVKGHMRDDARVKLSVAAGMFPEFTFQLVTRPKGQGWIVKEV